MSSSSLHTLAAAALVFGLACSNAPAKTPAPPPTQVGIVTVAATSIPESYEFVGQVSPYRRVEVRSRVEYPSSPPMLEVSDRASQSSSLYGSAAIAARSSSSGGRTSS